MKLFEIRKLCEEQLAQAGVDTPELDARLLIGAALGLEHADFLMRREREITPQEQQNIAALMARRTAREPVARILGLREFWGLPFGLNEATLEPRPDTETIVELALAYRPKAEAPRLIDLGTGTGCILLSLLHEIKTATGLGVDCAPRALEQAKANADRLGLGDRATFGLGNWFAGLDERFDLVVSNPPYIPAADIPDLSPEVRLYDPRAALDGGPDGLAPYRVMIPLLPRYLNYGGAAVFEVGIHQAEPVARLLAEAGAADITIKNDLGGVARAVAGRFQN